MNLFACGILIFLALFVAWGYWRGMAKLLYKLLAFIIALVLAHALMPVVANLLAEHTQIDEKVKTTVENRIRLTVEQKVRSQVSAELAGNELIGEGEAASELVKQQIDEALAAEPDRNTQIEVLKSLQLPDFVRTALIENNNDAVKAEMGVDRFYDYVSSYAAKTAVNAVAYVLTWVITLIVMWVLFFAIVTLAKLPVIRTVDKFGGMVAGLAFGVLIVWALFAAAGLSDGNGFAGFVSAQIEDSAFLTALNSHNPFVGLVLAFTGM